MRTLLALLVLMAAPACAAQSPPPNDTKDAADALKAFAEEVQRGMTPEERSQFDRDVERSASDEMQGRARECGTSLVFSQEVRFEDRTVWVAQGSTPEQIACVQRSYPFVKDPAS